MVDIKDWLPEFSVSAEDDKDLMRYFVETKQIHQIINQNKWLVLGRKGTGKTAIYEYFNSQSFEKEKRITVPINFKDYPWPIHKLYKESMEGELNAYYRSWKYILVVQALIRLIKKIEEDSELNSDLRECKRIINAIYQKPNPTIIETIKNKLASIQKLSLPKIQSNGVGEISLGEISFEDVSKSSELISNLKTNAFTLLDYFQICLTKNSSGFEIFIVMDQLDENWLAGEIDEYSKILINLINVCKLINNDREFDSLRVILFLRMDIFESLRFNDKNKIYQSNSTEIRWDLNSLNEMFYKRIIQNRPEEVDLSSDLKSNSIFEVQFVRHGATPFKHILRRTFYRPRDVIVYFNKIRDAHKDSRKGLYSSTDLYVAERDFSISMYNELMDEWGNQKPEIEMYLSVLQEIGVQKFSYSDYSEHYIRKNAGSGKTEIQNSLSFLFQNSIIGQKPNVNWEFSCTNPYLQIDYSKQFYINNGLKSRLSVVEKRQVQ